MGSFIKPEIIYYLLVFLLPFIEVSFLEKIFVLKVSNLLAFLLGPLFLLHAFLGKKKILFPFLAPIVLLALVYAISIFTSVQLTLDDSLIGATGRNAPRIYSYITLFWLLFSFYLFWLTVNIVNTKEILFNVIKIYLFSAFLVSVYGIFMIAGHLAGLNTPLKASELDWVFPRLSSTALEPLFFANYLLTALPLAITLYLMNNDVFKPGLFLMLILVLALAFFMTFSTGAWAAFVFAGLFILLVASKNLMTKRVLNIAGLGLVFICLMTVFTFGLNRRINFKSAIASKIYNTLKGSTYQIANDYYKTQFVKYDTIKTIKPGDYMPLNLTIKNAGTKTWKSKGTRFVQLTHFWMKDGVEQNKSMIHIRAGLPKDIAFGESVDLSPYIRAPIVEGDYVLKFDLVEEYVGTFSDLERSLPLEMAVKVTGPVQYYAAEIKLLDKMPDDIIPDRLYSVKVNLKNTGTLAWNAKGKNAVKLSYRWSNKNNEYFYGDGARGLLPRDINPGETAEIPIIIAKPGVKEMKGFDNIKFDMVREGIVWFSEQDKTPSNNFKPVETEQIKVDQLNIHTVLERWWLWRAGINMFLERPIVGVGCGNYPFLYNKYKPFDAAYRRTLPVINNQYLEILVETGIIGMLAFVFFAFQIIKYFIYSFSAIKENAGKSLTIGFLACLLAVAIQLNLFCGKSLNYIWVVLGLTIATIKLYTQNEGPL